MGQSCLQAFGLANEFSKILAGGWRHPLVRTLAATYVRQIMTGLTNQEAMKVVNRYIGVSGGYLGDFSYRTHAEFYQEYCDLEIDPYQYQGTTRERFIIILKNSLPDVQAKIVRGVLQRFPLDAENKPATIPSNLNCLTL